MQKIISTSVMAATTIAVLLSGCDTENNDPAFRMVESSVDEGRAFGMQRDLLGVTRSIDWDLGPDEVAAAIAAELGDCASVSPSSASFAVDLGDADEGASCVLRGRTYLGRVTISASENDGLITVVNAYDLKSEEGEASMVGTTTIEASESQRLFRSDIEVSRRGRTATMSGERTEVPLDPEVGFDGGVLVHGTRTMDASRGTMTKKLSGLEFLGDELVPQAGTISIDGGRRALSLTFGRVDDETVEATVEGPRGEVVITIDAETGDITGSEGSLGGRGFGPPRGRGSRP